MILSQPAKCSEHSPFHIEIRNIKEHPWHMHGENTLEVIYVLKGTLSVGISIYPSVMKQGDIAVVNSETLHSYQSDADNAALICHIDLSYFSAVISDIEDTLIICNSASAVEYDKHYELLRKALADVFVYYFDIAKPMQDELMDSCVSFLSILYNHFNFLCHEGSAIKAENTMKQKPEQAVRVKRVMRYIYDNLSKKISLEDIAAKEYVSKYYLSHLVSEFLNMPFRDYLSMTRAVYAQEYLYGTDLSLVAIAEQCGFSSAEAFRKSYLKHAGITPFDDRKRIAGHTTADIPILDEDFLATGSVWEAAAMMQIKTASALTTNALAASACPVTNVSIDLSKPDRERLACTWDTITLDDPLLFLSHKTLEALSILRDHGCFSKLHVKAEILISLYERLESWDFMGTFLKTMKQEGFTLLVQRSAKESVKVQENAPQKRAKNMKSTEFKNDICKHSDCFAELSCFSSEIGGAEIQYIRETPANLNAPTAPANANTPAEQKNSTASNAQAMPKKTAVLNAQTAFSTQTKPTDSNCNEPADIIANCLSGLPQYPSLFKSNAQTPYLFDENNLKTKAFYPYYFLNKLQSHSLYLENGCCVTHAKGKIVILLYNNGTAEQEKHREKNEPAKESICNEDKHTKKNGSRESNRGQENGKNAQKPGDTGIRKYMFNLKHMTKPLIYQCLTLDENYESEAEIFASLSPGSLALDAAALAKNTSHEILRRIQIKAYPDMKIASIDALPEYNLFLSSPPHTVTLIELE